MPSLKAIAVAAALAAGLQAATVQAATYKATLAQNMSPISGVTIVAKEKGFFEKNGQILAEIDYFVD